MWKLSARKTKAEIYINDRLYVHDRRYITVSWVVVWLIPSLNWRWNTHGGDALSFRFRVTPIDWNNTHSTVVQLYFLLFILCGHWEVEGKGGGKQRHKAQRPRSGHKEKGKKGNNKLSFNYDDEPTWSRWIGTHCSDWIDFQDPRRKSNQINGRDCGGRVVDDVIQLAH